MTLASGKRYASRFEMYTPTPTRDEFYYSMAIFSKLKPQRSRLKILAEICRPAF